MTSYNSRAPGQVAQLVEQRTENPRVGGSIPSLATRCQTPFLVRLELDVRRWTSPRSVTLRGPYGNATGRLSRCRCRSRCESLSHPLRATGQSPLGRCRVRPWHSLLSSSAKAETRLLSLKRPGFLVSLPSLPPALAALAVACPRCRPPSLSSPVAKETVVALPYRLTGK